MCAWSSLYLSQPVKIVSLLDWGRGEAFHSNETDQLVGNVEQECPKLFQAFSVKLTIIFFHECIQSIITHQHMQQLVIGVTWIDTDDMYTVICLSN